MRETRPLWLVAVLAGCSQSAYVNPSPGNTHADAGHGVTSIDAGTPSDDAATPIDDAPDDSGVDVFTGAPAYVPQSPPPSILTWKHLFKTGKVQTGLDCNECHDGSMGEAPLLAFGGTIYYDGTTQTVPGAEIRVIDAAGVATSVYSDADGNFWLLGDPKAYKWAATTGVRDAKNAVSMADSFSDAGCNKAACHDGSASAPRVTLPSP